MKIEQIREKLQGTPTIEIAQQLDPTQYRIIFSRTFEGTIIKKLGYTGRVDNGVFWNSRQIMLTVVP